jgi:hypothetical protein
MGDTSNFGFARLVPGFDFLQNLARGAAQSLPQMPGLSNWIAPTLNVEELDKRISELKAVHFWLDQNGKALAATIQALEVQKMTLATLQGMNFKMGDIAGALKANPAPAPAPAREESHAQEPEPAASKKASPKKKPGGSSAAGGAAVDPLQWWGALTQQFQQIAANAMEDVAPKPAAEQPRPAGPAPATAAAPAAAPAPKAARKAPARKSRTKSPR